MTRFFRYAILAILVLPTLALADEGPLPTKRKDIHKAIPTGSMSFTPAKARRVQTVTWKLHLKLAPGWHTYPTQIQAEQAKSSETGIAFPNGGDVVPNSRGDSSDGARGNG